MTESTDAVRRRRYRALCAIAIGACAQELGDGRFEIVTGLPWSRIGMLKVNLGDADYQLSPQELRAVRASIDVVVGELEGDFGADMRTMVGQDVADECIELAGAFPDRLTLLG